MQFSDQYTTMKRYNKTYWLLHRSETLQSNFLTSTSQWNATIEFTDAYSRIKRYNTIYW